MMRRGNVKIILMGCSKFFLFCFVFLGECLCVGGGRRCGVGIFKLYTCGKKVIGQLDLQKIMLWLQRNYISV